MKKSQKTDGDTNAKLSPEKAFEILKNVFRACNMDIPKNCEYYFFEEKNKR